MRKLFLIITTIIFTFTLNSVFAAEIEVKMLNKDADGNKMIFEPMLIMAEKGDTVTFLPTEKGHMAASIKGMLPKGIKKFKGKINCNIMAFSPTKPPTVKAPSMTCFVEITIRINNPSVTMSACPKLSIDNDFPVLTAKNS